MNKRILIIGGVVLAAIIALIATAAATNNRAISLEEQVKSAESDVRVQEKHEADTILSTVEARNKGKEVSIDNVTAQISAVAEAYPDLKSSENYKELMNELAITENKISESRNSYNNQIRKYNKYTRKFPNKQILEIIGYQIIEYEYLEYSTQDKEPVSNLFGD